MTLSHKIPKLNNFSLELKTQICISYLKPMNSLKAFFIFISFIFLNGCLQSTALLAPGITVASTGNVFQAGLQYGANTAIKKETGKDTFEHLQDVVENQNKDKKFKVKFTDLVEKKFEIAREKLKLN